MKQLIFFILLFPVFYNITFYLSYFQIMSKLDQSQDKVVIFYDDFHATHGNIVVDIFTSATNSDFTLLKIDYKETRIEALELVITDLIKQNKKVFLNISISPNDSVYAAIFSKILIRLSEYKNIEIAISSGNQHNTAGMLGQYTHKGFDELDKEIYTGLNKHSKEIKEISLDEDIDFLISNFGSPYGVVASNIYKGLLDDRDTKMSNLVSEVVRPILLEHGVEYEEEIISIYTKNIIRFAHTVLLQSKEGGEEESRVMVVSSGSQFEDASINEFFLDCRIENLVDNSIRETGIRETENGLIIGTSISAPVYLSKVYNKRYTQ